ncbi:GDNF family receptor alpha-4 isoform X2 [Alexandromys fortis]|uniref:GDNF family receptor alpha-4 isoform X2 n=1 Tax=Alexandromys fortis TaxID=100897 RepID=UPI0021521E0A|nr:GDNF family receptor alpha-4 isoform X2 [Microtus fortis]
MGSSLPVPHQGLRAPPAGIAAWPRPRRAQQTRSASSCARSMWHDAWARRRPRTGADPGAACAPAAAALCAASSPAGLRRSRMRCSFASARARRAPSVAAKLSLRPARSRAPGRRRPRACRSGIAASVAACAGACGTGWAAHGRPGARRPRLLVFQASCAPVPGSRDSCPKERGPRCRLAYAGLIGTAITPNYLDNVSARIAPWCGCGDSGNRLEECEAFRKLFTRNPCLDGAMQAFNPLWPSILQDWMKPYQNTGHCFPQALL